MSLTIYGASLDEAREVDFPYMHDPWLARILTDLAGAQRIGVIAPTCVEGIGFWKAALNAGKTPVMLHFPTAKLSRDYWRGEIAHVAKTLALDAVAYYGPGADPGLDLPAIDIAAPTPDQVASPVRPIDQGVMTQLSSGTTGHRKGVTISVADAMTHVAAYNQALGLEADACIVSWLPLYHDMGFVAAFLMPLMLNVRLVLIDPITWVRQPQLLFQLIERHRATHCYMPNFGFELMARQTGAGRFDLSSMKRWISCSEPTRIDSMRRFAEATGTDPARMSNCYAMAENIFAVTLSEGLKTRAAKSGEAVSCGRPIPGVDVKIDDGEIWVRSPYSLLAYEGGETVVDADGFYATGDLGEIDETGELYVLGRKRDVMIHAGRKFILSDIDHAVGRMIPQSAGRIATVPAFNALLGTDDPVCLVEDERYWARNREAERLAELRDLAGLEQGRLEFVPPGFITKTSSGKINRRLTGEHWTAAAERRRGGRRVRAKGKREFLRDLSELFPGIDVARPFAEQLDSLGLVNAGILMGEYGLKPNLAVAPNALPFSRKAAAAGTIGPVIKIVSLFDGDYLLPLMPPVLSELGRELGVSIHYEHVCCPPAPILLSDLTFEDQFMARDAREGVYEPLSSALTAVRDADLIIVDDLVQMAWPAMVDSHYPKISHRFESGLEAEHLAVRWMRYSERNHLVYTDLIPSNAISLEIALNAIFDLEYYLGVPILKFSLCSEFENITRDWEVRYLNQGSALLDYRKEKYFDVDYMKREIFSGMQKILRNIRHRDGVAQNDWHMADQPHWCSWLVNPDLVDFALDQHDDFLVLGKRASIPYLSNEAQRRGKRLRFRSDLVCPSDQSYECVLQTGSWGRPVTDKPLYPLMLAGWGDDPANVSAAVATNAPPNRTKPLFSGRLIAQ